MVRYYDFIVINDRIEKAVKEVEAIIIAERCKKEERISCIERIKIPASRELTPSKRTEALEWFLMNVACREKDEEIREMAFKKLGLCEDLRAGGTD